MKIKQIIRNLLVGIIFVSISTPLTAMETSIDENKLDSIALTQGYGYKYANLRELEILCVSMRNKMYTVAVPIFVGISSANMQQFIKSSTGLDCTAEWQKIITHYFSTLKIQKQTLQTKQYPDGFLSACAQLEQQIKDAFNQIVQQLPSNFNFNAAFKVQDQNIDALIQAIAQKKERLMVRSTGKEDTKKLANAGGNESISNIEPTSKEILLAMRDVIASYVGKKSLIQRLGAGDESLFELVPFTPVLIQRMIGEQHPQQLPKCGVMFTEEPEGGISILELKNSDGSTKTTGITVIQAAYGHNEGVVNSLIPVDTFYININKHIYPIIRPKTYRMSPAATRTLELKKNEGPLVTNPALNAAAILVLKKFADLLEKHYQGPMDVEFVVNEQEKTIYIVQARPIVHNPNLPKPSYIINPDAIPQDQKIFGSAIGVAGGALRWCASKNSVVIASTIGQALTAYQNLGVQSAAVQSIIVGAMAPATSHEATTFRSEGKPVVYIKELNVVEQWLQNPETILVVSPQQGLVINWQGKENSIDALLTSHIATRGWVSYPIPPFMSASKDFAPHAPLTDEAIIALLPKAVDANQFMQTLAEKEIVTPWKEYVHKLKTGTPDEASIVLATLLYEISQAIARTSQGIILDEDTQQRITLLQNYLLSIAYQIQANAHYTQTDPDYTRRLLPIHFLQTLLYQQPMPTEIVDGYSAATLLAKELAVEQAIIQELQNLGITPDAFTIQYLKIGQTAMTPELEQQWKQFVLNLAKQADKSTKDAFAHLILNLGKLNMLPIWLHTSFAQTYQLESSAPEVAQRLVKEYVKESAFLNQLVEKKAIIDALNIDTFGDPKKFATQWQTFNTDLLQYFISDTEFITSFAQANNFGKLAALGIMTKFVDTFDLSIKAVTGRPKDNVNEIITHFKTMLDGYAALFKKWVTLVPEGAIRYSKESPLPAYIKFIDTILNRQSFTAKDLQSTEFNVSAFTIGSGVDFIGSAIVHPSTLENIFTMTHQCLLVVLNVLNSQAGIKDITLPKSLQTVENELLKLKNERGDTPVLIGMEFAEKSIALFYNLPLRDHSIQIQLQYNKKTNAIILALNFFGDNMSSRWDLMYGTALLLQFANIFNINEIDKSNDNFKLALRIDTKNDNKEVYDNLQKIIDYSYNPGQIFDFTPIPNIDDAFEKAIKYAETEMQSTDQKRQTNALGVFTILAGQGKIIEQVQQIAINATESTDSLMQSQGLNLLTALINQGDKIPEAESIAIKAAQSTNSDMQYSGLILLTALIDQGNKIPEAESIAVKTAQSTYLGTQQKGFDLLISLTNKGNKIPEAETTAIKAAQSTNSDMQYSGLILLTALIDQGNKIPEAESIAVKTAQSTDEFTQQAGLYLLNALINQGNKIPEAEAVAVATKATESTSSGIQQTGLNLLKALVEKGHEFKDAEAIASKALQSTNEAIKQDGLSILLKLIKQGHKIHDAESIVIKATQLSTRWDMQEEGFDLLVTLINQGHIINEEEVIAVAIKAIQNIYSYSSVEKGFNILTALINQGYKINTAETIILTTLQNPYKQQLALNILLLLVRKQPVLGLRILNAASAYPNLDLKPTIESLLQDQEVSENTKKELQIILNEMENKKVS